MLNLFISSLLSSSLISLDSKAKSLRVELESLLSNNLNNKPPSSSPQPVPRPSFFPSRIISRNLPPVPTNSPSLSPSNSSSPMGFARPIRVGTCDGDDSSSMALRTIIGPSSSPSSDAAFRSSSSLISDSDEDTVGSAMRFHPSSTSSIKGLVGLGITCGHSGEFDGVGLVSIHPWSRKYMRDSDPLVLGLQILHHDEEDVRLSDTFLQEAAMTFIQDPLHVHSLTNIPEYL